MTFLNESGLFFCTQLYGFKYCNNNSHNLTSVICFHSVWSIWTIAGILSGVTTPGQSGPETNGNKRALLLWRCPWCNGYRRRKWTRRHEFKSWTRLIAFHIALVPLGKVWIQLFSLQLWVNSRADYVLQPWYYLPTPPLGQDMTQGQLNSEFSFS